MFTFLEVLNVVAVFTVKKKISFCDNLIRVSVHGRAVWKKFLTMYLMYYENFSKEQVRVRVNWLVFCYYSLRKLDWAEMAPCP